MEKKNGMGAGDKPERGRGDGTGNRGWLDGGASTGPSGESASATQPNGLARLDPFFILLQGAREDQVTHLFFSRQLLSVEPLEVTERKDFQ